MKAARIVVLGVAIAAGGLAALLAGGSPEQKPETVAMPATPQMDTVDILVARSDIGMGQTVSAGELQWQPWPASTSSPNFINKNSRPDAIEALAGSIARAPFVMGEPVREAKLVKAKGSGFMAAILPAGMRAISTEINAETSAGGFILPNDHVDVILSRRNKDADKGGSDGQVSETILTNVRVLAIDQNVEEKNGQKVVVGKTATLELAPQQAETLALARQQGSLSLALRSIVDSGSTVPDTASDTGASNRGAVNVVRYGVSTTATAK